jgi:hypothetical protein
MGRTCHICIEQQNCRIRTNMKNQGSKKGAGKYSRCKCVLRQIIFSQKLCRLQSNLVRFCKGVFTNELNIWMKINYQLIYMEFHARDQQGQKKSYLHNFVQIILPLQHLTCFCPNIDEIWIKLLIERLEGLQGI